LLFAKRLSAKPKPTKATKEKKRAIAAHRFPDFPVGFETLQIFLGREIKISV